MEELGPLARLAAETRSHHGDADADLLRLLAAPSAQAYRSWLRHRHGMLAPIEAALDATPHLAGTIDLEARRKAPRLRSDLLALGIALPEIAAAPLCPFVPSGFATPVAALGWMYVNERATLTLGNAYRALARVLPGEVAFAAAFLKAYEANVGVMWRGFVAALDATCRRTDDINELVAAARSAFRTLRRWDMFHGGARTGRAPTVSHG